jgi:transketolase|tara:strand:+ start:414 stop:1337 length:924 start_codon:yes stop_codon:yes gene_type:complete
MRKTCLDTVYNIATKNKKVVFVGSDLGPGVLNEFKKNIPERFYMEGVCEQAIIGLSAGLALEGFIPYVNTIATFITRRCFEQIVVDLCLHNLPVKLIGNGGGLVYAPLGPTHQAIEDLSIMRSLPNMSIISPCDALEMRALMQDSAEYKGPLYVRIARGGEKIITSKKNKKIGEGDLLIEPKDYLFITTGVMAQRAIEASRQINSEENKTVGVLHMPTVKPLDKEILLNWIPKVKKIVTIEENVLAGGFGSSILEFVNDKMPDHSKKITRLGLPDKFIKHYGTQEDLLNNNFLSIKNIKDLILKQNV